MTERQRTISRSMFLVTGGVLASRVLGLVRDILFARVWGAQVGLAAFLIAFTVPNLLRALFGEGAFSAAFVPVLSHRLERDGEDRAWTAASSVITVLGTVLAGVVFCGVLAAVVMRGVAGRNELARLTLDLLPWLLPYAFFICLVGAFAGVLHTLRRFAVPSLSSALLNLALIGGTAWAALSVGRGDGGGASVWVLVWAVLIAGCLQLGVQVFFCRHAGYRFRFVPRLGAPEVGEVARLMAPALVGAGVVQLNVAVDRLLGGWLGASATTSLYYSQRLVYLPVGLFGVALGIVALPAMSRAAARDDPGELLSHLRYALRHAVFLSLPAVVLFAVSGRPVIRLLFERGKFDATAVAATAWALQFYVPGIPAFVAAKIAVAPYYARKDTATPVRVAALCLGLNVVLNLILMQFMAQGGLALSTSICSFLNVALLLNGLRRDLGPLGLKRTLPDLGRTAACGAAAAAAAVGLVVFWPAAMRGEGTLLRRFLAVACSAGVIAAVYAGTAAVLGCPELRELLGAVRHRRAGG